MDLQKVYNALMEMKVYLERGGTAADGYVKTVQALAAVYTLEEYLNNFFRFDHDKGYCYTCANECQCAEIDGRFQARGYGVACGSMSMEPHYEKKDGR